MGAELKLAIFGGLFLCFRYPANFSSMQSVLLAIVASEGYRLYESLEADRRAKQYFVPYRVDVSPNWYELLRDYQLISDDESSRETYKKLSLGIKFSVLQRSRREGEDDLPGLIYWDDHKTFVTDVDFSIPIPDASCKGEYRAPELYFREGLRDEDKLSETDLEKLLTPRVAYTIPKKSIAAEKTLWKELGEKPPKDIDNRIIYFKRRLELGLKVPTSWWEQMCTKGELKELAKTEAYPDKETGRTELVIATLPVSLFHGYYHKPWIPRNIKRLAKQRELIDRQLVQNGWKEREKTIFDGIGSPRWLKHKYFTVWPRPI